MSGPTYDVQLVGSATCVSVVELDTFLTARASGSAHARLVMPITGPSAFRALLRFTTAPGSTSCVGAVTTIALADLHLGFWQAWMRDRHGPWPHGNPLAAIEQLRADRRLRSAA